MLNARKVKALGRAGQIAGLAFAVLAFALAANGQQVAINQQKSEPASKVSAQTSASDREKELLDKIDLLEKRIAALEVFAFGGKAPSTGGKPAESNVAAAKPSTDAPATVEGKAKDDKKVVEEGVIPASIRIPGTDLSLRIGGYIKADVIHDFQGVGNQSQFATNTIPINGTPNADLGGGTNIQARESRVSLEIVGGEDKTKYRAYVEGDFYGDGNAFRLRHAFGEYGGFLAGQTWTTFMDFSGRPRTLDYEGPDGEIFVRQAMLRYTHSMSKHWKFAVAIEQPTVQLSTLPTGFTGNARGNMPDFTGFVRYEGKRFDVQFAGVARSLNFDGTGTTQDQSTAGWGSNTSFKLRTMDKDALMGSFAFGSGIGHYIESMNSQNVDALFGAGNQLVAVPARSGVIGYERHWSSRWMSAFAYSFADISRNTGFAHTVIKRTQDARANLIFTPFRLFDIGAEVIWGRRDNQDGSHGDATRLMFSTIYRFN